MGSAFVAGADRRRGQHQRAGDGGGGNREHGRARADARDDEAAADAPATPPRLNAARPLLATAIGSSASVSIVGTQLNAV